MTWDLIGDIHRHDQSLRALLQKLGHREREGCWRHPNRRAIFLTDFIDCGPGQRAVLDIMRSMIESGSALAVMGDHLGGTRVTWPALDMTLSLACLHRGFRGDESIAKC